MSFLRSPIPSRHRRWHAVDSALAPATRSCTLREELAALVAVSDRPPRGSLPPDRLAALVEQGLAPADRPDAPATGKANPELQGVDDAALSDAENEGWPVLTRANPDTRPVFRAVHPAAHRAATGDEPMATDWSNGTESTRESDAHVAALLTSALLTGVRATTGAGTTTAAAEAAHAVRLYRYVLAALGAPDGKLEDALAHARTERGEVLHQDARPM